MFEINQNVDAVMYNAITFHSAILLLLINTTAKFESNI